MAKTLCSSCASSIWCPTWSEWKCKKHGLRMYSAVASCNDYSARPKGFKEPACQCKDCLVNDIILDEADEETDGE